jgi:hypothetical protein
LDVLIILYNNKTDIISMTGKRNEYLPQVDPGNSTDSQFLISPV